jgi:hypothetical protein
MNAIKYRIVTFVNDLYSRKQLFSTYVTKFGIAIINNDDHSKAMIFKRYN